VLEFLEIIIADYFLTSMKKKTDNCFTYYYQHYTGDIKFTFDNLFMTEFEIVFCLQFSYVFEDVRRNVYLKTHL